jgi:hypothetical protein
MADSMANDNKGLHRITVLKGRDFSPADQPINCYDRGFSR